MANTQQKIQLVKQRIGGHGLGSLSQAHLEVIIKNGDGFTPEEFSEASGLLEQQYTEAGDEKIKKQAGIHGQFDKSVLTLSTLLTKEYPENDWLVKDLIPKGCTFISGMAKNYKSYISASIAYSLSTNSDLFGNKDFETIPCKVLVFDKENGERRTARRLRQLNFEDNENLIYTFTQMKFHNDEFLDMFIEYLLENKIDVVVFDTFRRFFDGDENNSEVVSSFFDRIKKVLTHDISVIILHHHVKPSNNNRFKIDLSNAMRGSGDINASLDCHLACEKEKIGEDLKVKITQVVNRDAEELDPFYVDVAHPEGDKDKINFEFSTFVKPDEGKDFKLRMEMKSFFKDHKDEELAVAELKDVFGDCGKDLIRDVCKALVRDSFLSNGIKRGRAHTFVYRGGVDEDYYTEKADEQLPL